MGYLENGLNLISWGIFNAEIDCFHKLCVAIRDANLAIYATEIPKSNENAL